METTRCKVHAKVVVKVTATEVGLVGHGCTTRGVRKYNPCPTKVHFVDVNSYALELNSLLYFRYEDRFRKVLLKGSVYSEEDFIQPL